MRRSDPRTLTDGGRRAATLLCVFLVFGVETVFAAVLPLHLVGLGLGDPGFVGIVLALSNGAGLLLLPFLVAVIDGPHRARAMQWSAGAMIAGCALVVLAGPVVDEGGDGVAAIMVAGGVLVFGAARVLGCVCLLTEVARLPGDRTLTQGWNGAAQRSGSGLAVLAAGGLIAMAAWTGAYVVVIAVLAGWIALVAFAVPRRARHGMDAPGADESGAEVSRADVSGVEVPAAGARRSAFAPALACLAQLRRPRVLASAALNVIILLVLLIGNSFAALALAPALDETSLAALLIATIVVRDACSVLAGIGYGAVRRWLGESGMVAVIGVAATASLVLLAIVPTLVGAHLVAAVVQGVLVGFGIATTNLLATTGDTSTPPGIRIAASQLPAGAVLLVAPIGFGVIVGGAGPALAYAALALLAALAAAVMVSALRSGAGSGRPARAARGPRRSCTRRRPAD